jgi:uncharacterized surface protein with fasciclin (FAS1) repeats
MLVIAAVALAAPAYAGDAPAMDIVATAGKAGSFTTLTTALTEAGLVETLQGKGPFTVFAPTDAAFAKLPAGVLADLLKPENKAKLTAILTYHVVAGKDMAKDVARMSGAVTVNGQRVPFAVEKDGVHVGTAKVVTADVACSNGVIHVIDSVILPETRNLVSVAKDAGKFQTLLAAATAAGLVPTLSGTGPFTLFAPTDAAFAKLPAGTVESLLKPENKAKLAAILTYHVVPGRVYSEQALKAGKAKTVQGGEIEIVVKDGKAMVNNAAIVTTDINASNGAIHVIDTVIMPPQG